MMSNFAFWFMISAIFTGSYLLNYINRMHGCFIGASLVIINLIGLGTQEWLNNKDLIIKLGMLY